VPAPAIARLTGGDWPGLLRPLSPAADMPPGLALGGGGHNQPPPPFGRAANRCSFSKSRQRDVPKSPEQRRCRRRATNR
jgi:hypothetical protein